MWKLLAVLALLAVLVLLAGCTAKEPKAPPAPAPAVEIAPITSPIRTGRQIQEQLRQLNEGARQRRQMTEEAAQPNR